MYKRIIAGMLAVLSLAFCGCNKKEPENEEQLVLPTVRPYKEPGKIDVSKAKIYTVDSDTSIVSPDGVKYEYYASQEGISSYSDFNLWENMGYYLGYVEGQKLTQNVWNELGFATYEDYRDSIGDFEFGIYAMRKIPGNDDMDDDPEFIITYFYDKQDEMTVADLEDGTVVKVRLADIYRRVDEGTEKDEFNYRNCSAFVLQDGGRIADKEARTTGGIRNEVEVAEFIEYLNNAQLLAENPVQDGYYSYLYKKFYNKNTNKFNESPEYEEAKKQRKTLMLVGVLKDNDAFAVYFTVEKYGDYGYSVNIDGTDYVLPIEWAEKLLKR